MPPAKSSRNHDDHKSDAHHPKEKNGTGHSSTKMRRGASQQSHLREVTNAAAIIAPQPPAEPIPPSVCAPLLQLLTSALHSLHEASLPFDVRPNENMVTNASSNRFNGTLSNEPSFTLTAASTA